MHDYLITWKYKAGLFPGVGHDVKQSNLSYVHFYGDVKWYIQLNKTVEMVPTYFQEFIWEKGKR